MATEEGSVASNGPLGGGKDRDPPPAFDGADPDGLKKYLRDLELWRWETDVPKLKHALKMLRQLSGSARAAADEVPVEEVRTESGVEAIVRKLKEHFQPHLESAMPKAFEKAVYGDARRSKESMQDYIIRVDKAFKELSDEGVQLSEEVRGYILYRQANLSSTQEDQVVTWTSGQYGRATVVRALRKLEKVHKDKGQKAFVAEESAGEGSEAFAALDVESDHDIENYVYMLEGDMDQIFEEQGLQEALATYQQVRKALRDQKNSRGWNKGGGKGVKGYPGNKVAFGGSGNRGGLHFNQGSKVHIESLKLRTRCARCGVVGHWAKECSNAPDEFARSRSSAAASTVKSAASSLSGRSGFVHITSTNEESHAMVTKSQVFQTSSFCGVATHGAFGLVDTAAQSGLIGKDALERLEEVLKTCGLKVRWTDRKAQARGVGGEAKVKGVVEIPLGLGGVNGVLEATVIEEDVPLLIPVRLLRDLRAVIDFSTESVMFRKHGAHTTMSILPSGHASISVTEFAPDGWELPREAQVRGMKSMDFEIGSEKKVQFCTAAMFEVSNSKFPHHLCRCDHGELAEASQGHHGVQRDRRGEPTMPASLCCMAQSFGQGDGLDRKIQHGADARSKKVSRNGASLARHWLALWIATTCGTHSGCATFADVSRAYQQAGGVGDAENPWHSSCAKEMQNDTKGAGKRMPTSQGKPEWSRQPVPEGSVVPRLPFEMEGINDTFSIEAAISAGVIDDVESNRFHDDSGHRISAVSVGIGGDAPGDEMQVQPASQSAQGEERGSDEGEALLQVPCSDLRLFRMGSSGDGKTSRSQQEGAGGQSRGEQEAGRVGERQEGASDSRRVHQRAGGLGAHDATVTARGCEEPSGHGGGASGTTSSRGDGDAAEPLSESDRAATKSAVLADGTGWRAASAGGHAGPQSEQPGDEAGNRAATEDDGESGARQGGGKSKPRPNAQVKEQEAMPLEKVRCGNPRGEGDRSAEGCGDPGGEETRTAPFSEIAWLAEKEDNATPPGRVRCGDPGGEGTRSAMGCEDPGGEGNRTAPLPEIAWLAKRKGIKRDLAPEEMEQALKCAPWATKLEGEKAWNTAILRQIQDEQKLPEERVIQPMFWTKTKEGWKFHQGILPVQKPPEEVVLVMDEGPLERWTEEDAEGGVLKKGIRKRIQRCMKELTVSEVYSEPRLTKTAARLGLQAGSSFDLKTGYDLSTPKGRQRCWRQLELEDPDLLLVCPPCGPFSALQNLNYDRMEFRKAMVILGKGVEHLTHSMRMYEWQVRRGKKAIFEHPATSKGWDEPCVQRVLKLPGVKRVRGDQCQYELRVAETGELSKKPTDFMVNGENMAKRLSMRCQGGHTHAQLMNGRAKKAEKYPEKLCEAMVKGFKEDARVEGSVVFAFEVEDALDEEVMRHDGEGLEDGEHPQVLRNAGGDGEEEESAEEELPRGLTDSDKRKIRKLHNNLGHPSQQSFMRALKVARARQEVLKYVKESFRCDICEAHTQPKAARPSTLPKHFEPGKIIGIDVVFMPSNNPRVTIPVLNVIDWATCYQTLEPLEGRLSETIWKAFMRSWVRTFGMPEIVVCDQGREFMSSFCRKVNEGGSIIRTIGARSPWQQGRTERHGGLAKGMLKRVVDQVSPTSYEEWVTCVYEVECAKNRMFNRSGFSPTQRQIGMNIRIPGSLSGDDPYDPVTQRSTNSSDLQRLMAIREASQEAFLKHSTHEAIQRASQGRPRVARDFTAGEAVYVYRKPLPRKNGGGQDGRVAQWCGPGSVVMQEGPNVWIAMRGEMWKCAKEQVRSATPEEEEAYGLLKDEFKELQAELGRKGSKRGFKDTSNWELPPTAEQGPEEEEEMERPTQRPRIIVGEDDGYEPTTPASRAEASVSRNIESSTQSSSPSNASNKGKEEANSSTQVTAIPPEWLEQATESVMRNERMDGTRQPFAPTRSRLENIRMKPYDSTLWAMTEEPPNSEDKEDEWVFHEESRSLLRLHRRERRGGFFPQDKLGCPIPVKYLQPQAVVYQKFLDGKETMKKVSWRAQREEEGPRRFWEGFTEFKVKPKVAMSKITEIFAAGRGSDEVKESDIKPEEWAQWRVADGEEWTKVEASGAVKPLTLEESQEVEKQLSESGQYSRILPSTMVRRWKPAELPGDPPSMKSRWCIRGDKDPDLLSLDRYSPTVSTAVVSIALQTACSRKFRCAIGDLKNAFMQSEPLTRPQGRLFCKQPRGGLPGLTPGQLLEILAGAYGLGDAPLHWRKSLLKVLVQLGYKQSSMDPCTFRLFKQGKLCGLIVVEVDDLLTMGDQFHFQKMEELQRRFKFGKFKFLDEEEKGVSFNGRRLRLSSDGTYRIDMQKFVEERLKEVNLQVGRASQKEQEATEAEKAEARAVVGALTWAAKEGRPDCAAAASLIAGTLNHMKVQDILDLNKAVKEAKKSSTLSLKIQHIDPDKMIWGVVTDASYANASGGNSQGAFGVVCAEEKILEKGKGKINLLHWRSGKMHRVVNSTLAAESQSLSRGLSELAWSVTVYKDLITEDFNLREWQQALKDQRIMTLAKENAEERLKKCLCVVDAKSLFDHLVKETIGQKNSD